jgi:hypothetical protein
LPASELVVGGVSDRLKQAYYRVSGWALCGVDGDPECVGATPQANGVGPDRSQLGWRRGGDWLGLLSPAVIGSHVVLVSDLSASAAECTLMILGPTDSTVPPTPVRGLNPNGQGIFYFDLGSLDPGRYAVQVAAVYFPEGPGPDEWRSFVAGFTVEP